MSKSTLMLPALLVLALLACDDTKPVEAKQVEAKNTASLQADSQVSIAAKDLELAAVVELIEREDVRDAESLEALINADDSTIDVDIDKDGKRDFVSVHEVEIAGGARAELEANAKVEATVEDDGALTITGEDGQKVRFELRAIPSSKVRVEAKPEAEAVELTSEELEAEAVLVATVDLELHAEQREVVIEASYAPELVVVAEVEVERRHVHQIELEHRSDHLVVVGAPFVAWVWIGHRPVYVGHVHLPPGHAKKLGLHWHHPGRGRGHGHHPHKHGGPDKVHVKVKGDGGKVHVKSKGGKGGKGKGGKGGKGKR
ncbi:MAG: hypothetical protein R6X02_18830 [Enhygromyxa sp.]